MQKKVKTPDGTIITVEAPDGATDAEILAFAEQNYRKKEPPKPEQVNPADGISALQAGTIAAGRASDKMIQGIRQLWNKGLAELGDEEAKKTLEQMAAAEAQKDEAYAPLKSARPYSTMIGEAVPGLTISGRAGIPTQMALAGGMGGLKYGDTTDRLKEGAMEAAGTGLGAVLGKFVGNLVDPVHKNVMNETRQAAIEGMTKHGLNPRLSQVTGSPTVAAIERFAANNPLGRDVMRAHEAANEVVFNKAAAKSIGQDATELSEKVLQKAHDDLGLAFDAVKNLPGKPISIDSNVDKVARAILAEQNKLLPRQRNPEIISLAQDAAKMANVRAKIDGEAYQLQRSALSDAVQANEGMVARQYKMLLGALDDAADSSLNKIGRKDVADALKDARPKYANLKTLEEPGVVKGGDVNPFKMSNKMPRNELKDVANFGDSFKPLPGEFPSNSPWDAIAGAAASPIAWGASKVVTNPLVVGYAKNIGGTKGAEVAAETSNRAVRSMIDAIIQRRLDDLRTQGESK